MAQGDDLLTVELDVPLPPRLEVGAGSYIFLCGSCFHAEQRIRRLEVVAAEERDRAIAFGMPRSDRAGLGPRALWSGFWAIVPLSGGASHRVAFRLRARLEDGRWVEREIGEVEVAGSAADAPKVAIPDRPRIAIAMATYEPQANLFGDQIATLRQQTVEDWVCLISDDHSTPRSFELIRELTADDPRFVVSQSPQRLGFYRNFERALKMVPGSVEYVALCDQDDRWDPEKLAVLGEAIGDAALAYCDMRVVSGDEVIAGTYWTLRRNNYSNLSSLLFANTVTGAASLFRRELLERALPFPPPHGHTPHDQWLACVALAGGRIAYVDRPLQDYVQHRSSVFGHPALHEPYKRERRGIRGAINHRIERGRRAYFWDLIPIALMAKTLALRNRDLLSPRRRRTLRRASRLVEMPGPVLWLLARATRRIFGLNETQRRELTLLNGIGWRWLVGGRSRRGGSPGRLLNRADPLYDRGDPGEARIDDATKGQYGALAIGRREDTGG